MYGQILEYIGIFASFTIFIRVSYFKISKKTQELFRWTIWPPRVYCLSDVADLELAEKNCGI